MVRIFSHFLILSHKNTRGSAAGLGPSVLTTIEKTVNDGAAEVLLLLVFGQPEEGGCPASSAVPGYLPAVSN